jgi:hypothetical protein
MRKAAFSVVTDQLRSPLFDHQSPNHPQTHPIKNPMMLSLEQLGEECLDEKFEEEGSNTNWTALELPLRDLRSMSGDDKESLIFNRKLSERFRSNQ